MITKQNFFNLISEVSKTKGIPISEVENNFAFAIEKAYTKEYPDIKIEIIVDSENKKLELFEIRTVVLDDYEEIDEEIEITLTEAKNIKSKYQVGDIIKQTIDISKLDRPMAMRIKQVFAQKLTEGSNVKTYEEWVDKIGVNIRAEVESVARTNSIEVNLKDTIGVVLRSEQIPGERLSPGTKYMFFIKNVHEQTKGWPIILSRGDVGLVENLLRENIPEMEEGIIEIKAIARIPGFKTKIAVKSHSAGVDPIGTCVGPAGSRIKEIMKQINGEYIDIVLWDDDPKQFLVNACAPERIIGLEISDDEDSSDGQHKFVTIIVGDDSLPKMIGKKGMNIKLISKLTHWSIDIQSLTIAKEDKIDYEDVSHLSPSRHNRNADWQRPIGNHDERTNYNQRSKSFQKKGSNDDDFSFVNTHRTNKWDTDYTSSLSNSISITDEDIDDLLNFKSAPQKSKPININLNEDESEYRDKKNFGFVKQKKFKSKKTTEDKSVIFDEFDDITEDDLHGGNSNENSASEIDNLEFDDE